MDLARPVYRPPSPPRQNRLPAHVYWRRRALVLLAAATIFFVGYLGVTLAFALHNPSYGVSMEARAAEWGRQHGMGGVVTWIETEWYKTHPAKTGGAPPPKSFGSGPTTVRIPKGLEHLAAPATIATPAAHPLPGEGVWHVVGRRTPQGVPTVYEAFVRPDPVHTSYVVGVAWMDPTLLKAQLYSGSFIPGVGAPYRYTAPVSAKDSKGIVAAFNAGFRMQDANGGYDTQGRVLIPLRVGAASVVIFKDGTMTVGKWGATCHEQPDRLGAPEPRPHRGPRQGRRRTGRPEHGQVGQDPRRHVQRVALGPGRDRASCWRAGRLAERAGWIGRRHRRESGCRWTARDIQALHERHARAEQVPSIRQKRAIANCATSGPERRAQHNPSQTRRPFSEANQVRTRNPAPNQAHRDKQSIGTHDMARCQ